jgi:hypothetical protein
MTDRITPLPWKIEKIVTDGPRGQYLAVDIHGDNGSVHVVECGEDSNRTAKANAAYIVHCANNYPKLEALSAELVEVLEDLHKRLIGPFEMDINGTYPKKIELLIQKAKGMVSNG